MEENNNQVNQEQELDLNQLMKIRTHIKRY